MALTYEAYTEYMERHGFIPMTAKEWFKDEQERVPQVRKKKDSRPKPTTFEEFDDDDND